MKLNALRSPKLKRLMKLSGLSRVEAVGTLELLWLFTMDQAPSADVGRWQTADLEEELGWTGADGSLEDALVESGWLDRCSEKRLVVHDWAEHMPDFIKKRHDRGLEIFEAVQPSDDGGQRRTTATDGGQRPVRKGKESQGKESQGKESKIAVPPAPPASPATPASKSNGKSRRILIPKPDLFPGDSMDRLRVWGDKHGFGQRVLNAGLEVFREWVPVKPPYLRPIETWEGAFKKITRDGVADGKIKLTGDAAKPKGLAYAEWTGHGDEVAR